jgi:integrase
VAVFGYYTGWRKSEILGLTWGAVDLENGIARLEPTSSVAGTSTKNDEGRTVPIGVLPQLATALRNQRAYTDDVQRRTGQIVPWVFHREGKQIKKLDEAWRAACKRAKVPTKTLPRFPADLSPQSD